MNQIITKLLHTINRPNQSGFILLFTIAIISVTVGLSVTLISAASKQSQLGAIQSDAQAAFAAADAGMECGLELGFPVTPPALGITCGGVQCDGSSNSCTLIQGSGNADEETTENVWRFDFREVPDNTSPACGIVVYRYNYDWGTDPGESGIQIESYGYSVCEELNAGDTLTPDFDDPALIERKLLIRIPLVVEDP